MDNSDQIDPYNQPDSSFTNPYPQPKRRNWNFSPRAIIGIMRMGILLVVLVSSVMGRMGLFSPAAKCSDESLIKSDKYSEIIKVCTDAISDLPDSGAGYNNRGLGYLGTEQYDLALADFKKSLELEPNDPITNANLGDLYSAMEKYGDAVTSYSSAIQVSPTNYDAYLGRGWASYFASNYNQALSDVDTVLTKGEGSISAYYLRGVVYLDTGVYDQAITDLETARGMAPNNCNILYDLAHAYSGADQPDKSIADLQQILTLTDDPAMKQAVQARLSELQGD